ncbi:hypothetical protein TWF696_009847 [Orbilia brochopaga]|uniref:Uncharacterized protein n=1 Tax=Orbilia brochopaga TaxID=3140254 RepID=A0AAV9UCP8_9PEZI
MDFNFNYPAAFEWQKNETNIENIEARAQPGDLVENTGLELPDGQFAEPAPQPTTFCGQATTGMNLGHMPDFTVPPYDHRTASVASNIPPASPFMGMPPMGFPPHASMPGMTAPNPWVPSTPLQFGMPNMFAYNAENMQPHQFQPFTNNGMQPSIFHTNPMASIFGSPPSNNTYPAPPEPTPEFLKDRLIPPQFQPPEAQSSTDQQSSSQDAAPPKTSDASESVNPAQQMPPPPTPNAFSVNGTYNHPHPFMLNMMGMTGFPPFPTANVGFGSLATNYQPITSEKVTIIRDEPIKNTTSGPAPTDPKPTPLKTLTDPPAKTGCPGGYMRAEEAQEYLASMSFLGKAVSDVTERYPVVFENFAPMPKFEGDPNDLASVKEYSNVLVDWSNRFVRASVNGHDRIDAENTKLKKLSIEFQEESDRLRAMFRTADPDDESPSLSDCVERILAVNESLETNLRMLHVHHRKCPKKEVPLGIYLDAERGENTLVGNYQIVLARKDRQLRVLELSIEQKAEIIENLKTELISSKRLIAAHQCHIEELVNRNIFLDSAKMHVDEGLQQCLERNKNLCEKYNELQKRANALMEENVNLKSLIEHAGGEAKVGSDLPNISFPDLFAKYQKLFETAGNIVDENAKLREELKASEQAMNNAAAGNKAADEEALKQKEQYEQLLKEKQELERKLAQQDDVVAKLRQANTKMRNRKSPTGALEKGALSAAEFQRLTIENEGLQKKLQEQIEKNEGLAATNMELNNLHLIKEIELENMKKGQPTGGSLAQPSGKNKKKKKNKGKGKATEPALDKATEPALDEQIMTLGQLTSIMAEDTFREQMISYLRRVGAI